MGRKPNPYSRVTTVLESLNSSWIKYWYKSVGLEEAERIGKESTEFGRQVHIIAETYLLGEQREKRPSTEREQFCGNLLIKWLKEAQVVPANFGDKIAVEFELKSEKYKLIGHPDLFAFIGPDKKLWGIDWKTSKEVRLEYPLQLAAYAMMLEEQEGIVCNDGAIIRTPSDPNATPQFEAKEFHNLKEVYLPIFLHGLEVYNYFQKKGRWHK